jgi:hypothetical protein
VLHLKLAAIDLDDLLFAAVQQVGDGFDCFRFTGAGWPSNRKTPAERPSGASPE